MKPAYLITNLLIFFTLLIGGCSSSSLGPNKTPPTLINNTAAPDQVTLLLPLSGPLKASGQAVRNGFFAAYYAAKQHQLWEPRVQVLDTNQGTIPNLIQSAVNQGSGFIIGPLTKANVSAVMQMGHLPVGVLALNTLPTDAPIANLYQFGLSPRDEVAQIVERAQEAGYSQALIIAVQGDWGNNLLQQFTSLWQNAGGSVAGVLRYSKLDQLADQIQSLLHVNRSKQRYDQLKRITGQSIRFTPRRRQDADMIFLIAQASAARQIQPLLQYYFAANIPVYALSTLYTGIPDTYLDRDLDGIYFPDMPWVISPQTTLPPNLNEIRLNIQKLWPQSFKAQSKLYALGVDAYYLANQLGARQDLPSTGMTGATGRLYLSTHQQITRRLLWARMQNGSPALWTFH